MYPLQFLSSAILPKSNCVYKISRVTPTCCLEKLHPDRFVFVFFAEKNLAAGNAPSYCFAIAPLISKTYPEFEKKKKFFPFIISMDF